MMRHLNSEETGLLVNALDSLIERVWQQKLKGPDADRAMADRKYGLLLDLRADLRINTVHLT